MRGLRQVKITPERSPTPATSSTIYKSQKDAMQEMVNGMIVIADEVANGKISDPFNEKDTTLVESQFSFNSISDFQDNIRGIQNALHGEIHHRWAGA